MYFKIAPKFLSISYAHVRPLFIVCLLKICYTTAIMTDSTQEQKMKLQEAQTQLPSRESIKTPERAILETAPEKETKKQEKKPGTESGNKLGELLALRRKPKQTTIPQVRDEMTVKVEKILEEGIGDAYSRLSPVAKQEFKIKGEETAYKIGVLLKATHIKVKSILKLILEWLKLLPGVNRFFLEQEAKIKTDKIVAYHKKHGGM